MSNMHAVLLLCIVVYTLYSDNMVKIYSMVR